LIFSRYHAPAAFPAVSADRSPVCHRFSLAQGLRRANKRGYCGGFLPTLQSGACERAERMGRALKLVSVTRLSRPQWNSLLGVSC
jgi:hypothetical protein